MKRTNRRRLEKRNRHKISEIKSEINVTPFVDVMLVLLIIFMVAAPMIISGVKVNLPKANAGKVDISQKPIIISVTKTGNIFIEKTEIKPNEIIKSVVNLKKNKPNLPVLIKGDEESAYGNVIKLMAKLKKSGISSVSLILDYEE